jgi:hypothetical protein
MYKLTKYEQETFITWNAEDRMARIETAHAPTIAKLDKLVAAYPDTYVCTSSDRIYNIKEYRVPASYIKFGKPASEAQKAASRERAKVLPRKST